jgi:hypothetical protein
MGLACRTVSTAPRAVPFPTAQVPLPTDSMRNTRNSARITNTMIALMTIIFFDDALLTCSISCSMSLLFHANRLLAMIGSNRHFLFPATDPIINRSSFTCHFQRQNPSTIQAYQAWKANAPSPPLRLPFHQIRYRAPGLRLRPLFWQRKEIGLHGSTREAIPAAVYPIIHKPSLPARSVPTGRPGTNGGIVETSQWPRYPHPSETMSITNPSNQCQPVAERAEYFCIPR